MAFEFDIPTAPFQTNYFSIDAENLVFHDTQMVVADIVGFSYGTTFNFDANGIRVSTSYFFNFMDNSSDVIAFWMYDGPPFNSNEIFMTNTSLINYIWVYFGNRLLLQMIQSIHNGNNVKVGELTLNHTGIHFTYQTIAAPPSNHTINWDALTFRIIDEIITVSSWTNGGIQKGISLKTELNAHLFKAICELVQQNKLSPDVLTGKRQP
jgi:hypothetical protein